jgi:phage terminase Nu1 subunit (DNA packaging protein)
MAARTAKWAPDAEQRNLVESLTAFGLPIDEQLLLVKGEDGRALRADEFAQLFAPEILSGRAKANAQLGKALYDRALKGNVRALREWQKQSIAETVETRELTQWLGITAAMIAELEKRSIIRKSGYGLYPLRETIAAVVAHLREVAAGRTDADPQSGGALVTERARLARELADQASMRNGMLRGELVYIRDIIELLHECNRTVTTRILSLPSEASPQLHACSTVLEHQVMMRALLSEALEGLCREFGSERRQLN